ncbi:hypothetical protein BJV85_002679 [Clostridium acetobutylicum]|nr:hypothetical protein [Clostridium acetobutylicum]NOW15331.1 hypothetical protein [Clostridium acetobutylicum]NRY57010.1 hypothetical protein [Clostridium acetobutylicum]NSA93756.1 hypothetical protein [Clostridium acetobutylicum]NYC94880.1 hypothetical protein [Clostridium acetobutylicum]
MLFKISILNLEEYITKRKKEDNLNKFDIKNLLLNF